MSNVDYKAAYLRQKEARQRADQLLEERSRELYESNQNLIAAFEALDLQKSQLHQHEKLAMIGQLRAVLPMKLTTPHALLKVILIA
ncbi:MAG: two-component system NtrC family sensor kinase [Flavobacteriales bacterium]|jgi:two-component system NtrC family sensor kinase